MNTEELNGVLVTQARALPAVASVRAASAARAETAARPPAGQGVSGNQLDQRETFTELAVDIGVRAEVSAAATALAVAQTVVGLLEGRQGSVPEVVIRVVSIVQ